MTVSGDFIPEDTGVQEAAPDYPTAFGITLTPTVIGIILGLLGLGGALYLFLNVLQPALQRRGELAAEVRSKEEDLANQAAALQEVEEVEAELEAALAERRSVYGLFSSEEQLDTLIIDINRQIVPTNVGVADLRRQLIDAGLDPELVGARLALVEPLPDQSGVITAEDLEESTYYTEEVIGKLRSEKIAVGIQGDFAQIQSIIRNIERLEPLLIIRDFTLEESEINEEFSDFAGIKILDARMVLDALIPTSSPDELPEVETEPAEGEEGEDGEAPADDEAEGG
ncbi:MAG: hypothetical protein ACTS2F_18250 [Thainema sp.]